MAARGFWYNVLTSGTYDRYEIAQRSRIVFLNAVIVVGLVTLLSFSGIAFRNGNIALGSATAGAASVLVFAFLFVRLTERFVVGDYIASLSVLLLFAYLFLSGGEQGSGVLWLFSYPLIALFLHQVVVGSILSGLLFAVIVAGLFVPGIGGFGYSVQYGARIIGSYLFIYAFGMVYEVVRILTQNNLTRTNTELQTTTAALSQEKSQTDAIFAHVREGIFLMDDQFVIAPAFSAFMSNLFETEEIAGRPFIDLIAPYLTRKNADALTDYLPMLLDDSMNPELIREINPIDQVRLTLTDDAGAVREKYLQFAFEPINMEAAAESGAQVMAVVRDVSAEVELANQIAAEQHKHQRDMETLFQVLHVDPNLMTEFIEDSEQELANINNLLRDKGIGIPQTLAMIFQAVHNIKGNALLLGLEELGISMHNLENKIREVQELPTCTYKDLLPLTAAVGGVQLALEETNEIVQKLVTFQHASAEAGLTGAGLLERAIRGLAGRESQARGVQAQLNVQGFDQLPDRLRRPLRDVIIQLVRNSFAHGIESPEVRAKAGKSAVGTITISFVVQEDGMEMLYADDGAGIDFEAVRERAMRLPKNPLRPDEPATERELVRYLFYPNFSTAHETSLGAGRGVGMALVNRRIKELGGSIVVKSRRGRGMQLRFRFAN